MTNGPWVRAKRATRSTSGSGTGSVKTAGSPGGQGDTEGIAQAGGVLGGGEALLPRHADGDRAALADQAVEPVADHRRGGLRIGRVGAGLDLPPAERAEQPEQVVDLVGVARPTAVGEALQLELEVGEHRRIDQLAELLGAQQLAEELPVEGEGRGPTFGQRGVALVHVDGYPSEQQRLGER